MWNVEREKISDYMKVLKKNILRKTREGKSLDFNSLFCMVNGDFYRVTGPFFSCLSQCHKLDRS